MSALTREEAEALAAKRQAHKSKYMNNKNWEAVHDSVKGWHAALVDDLRTVHSEAINRARDAYRQNDLGALLDASHDAMIASLKSAFK